MKARRTKGPARHSREEWLARALDTLAAEGESKIRIETLARKLGVTKGSFYWHFKGRDDFLKQLVEYWAARTTQPVIDRIGELTASPEKRLLAVMETVETDEFARYDVPIRALAAHEPQIQAAVRAVDARRHRFCEALFAEMGFKGDELKMRTRLFVVYHSLEGGLTLRLSKAERHRLIRRRHAFLTAK